MNPTTRNAIKRLILAPMEGVLDGTVRQLLTELNQFDYCVTEFVRVTATLLPKKTFFRLCPELLNAGKTKAGTPVRVQLLGQDPDSMAANAERAIKLGSRGIDINAGCPAKTVVGNGGGAHLLKAPELLYQVVRKVRASIPYEQPLSVKIRLGWNCKSYCFDIAEAVESGGANEIAIHGRTKEDGYKADKIDWHTIGLIKQKLTIPVIANGEIISELTASDCFTASRCSSIMLGRGILQTPNLGNMIRFGKKQMPWSQVLDLLIAYTNISPANETHLLNSLYHAGRIKQWLSYLRMSYPLAMTLHRNIRTLQTNCDIQSMLIDHKINHRMNENAKLN